MYPKVRLGVTVHELAAGLEYQDAPQHDAIAGEVGILHNSALVCGTSVLESAAVYGWEGVRESRAYGSPGLMVLGLMVLEQMQNACCALSHLCSVLDLTQI